MIWCDFSAVHKGVVGVRLYALATKWYVLMPVDANKICQEFQQLDDAVHSHKQISSVDKVLSRS